MAYAKMRLLHVSLVVLGALCLYLSMYGLTPFKDEPFVFKKERGTFLQLPDINCRQEPPFLVLLVTSSHEQMFARTGIRNT